MSDDWRVVEDALSHAPPTTEVRRAFLALARLREREAQLEAHELEMEAENGYWQARVARLEEALRGLIAEVEAWGPQSSSSTRLREHMAAALAHEEEKSE